MEHKKHRSCTGGSIRPFGGVQTSVLKEDTKVQTFCGFLRDFLSKIKPRPKEIVEVGSDIQLKLALDIADLCDSVFCVDFPELCAMKEGWLEMHRGMAGVSNIRQIADNALRLSRWVSGADAIILRNVLLELEKGDTERMLRYQRGEIRINEKEMKELNQRFVQAEETAYREFLKVASSGYIIALRRPDDRFREMLIDRLGVREQSITIRKLRHDGSEELLDCYIIDNTR